MAGESIAAPMAKESDRVCTCLERWARQGLGDYSKGFGVSPEGEGCGLGGAPGKTEPVCLGICRDSPSGLEQSGFPR